MLHVSCRVLCVLVTLALGYQRQNLAEHAAPEKKAHSSGPLQTDRQSPDPSATDGSAAGLTGVQTNASGDLPVFLTGVATNVSMIGVFFVVFGVLRKRYPIVYAGNVQANRVPFEPSDSFFGWIHSSFALRLEDVVKHAGLDQAMLLEFNQWAMGLFIWLMVPLLCVMGPIHWIFGGDRSGDDHLSKLGMANVVDNHPWLYWVHSGLVWFVVLSVQAFVYSGQSKFLERRKEWLKAMPAPRSTTVLVQNIPEKHGTDKKVKAFFDSIFEADVVESVHVVKHTGVLVALAQYKEDCELKLQEALVKESKTGDRPNIRDFTGSRVDAINYYTEQSKEAAIGVREEQRRIKDAANRGDMSIFTSNAFVTFKSRRESEMALKATYTPDDMEFTCEIPPDPADVIYSDLQKDPLQQNVMTVVGYCLVAAVFWVYIPAVIGIMYITNINHVANYFPIFRPLAENESIEVLWNAMLGPLVLQLFIGFIPTFFVLIFEFCFVLKAQAWLQHRIHNWYFWFMVVYILLVSAVGSSLIVTLDQIIESPSFVFYELATTMPYATHFYLNFISLQWATHAQYLCRPVQLAKFKAWSILFEEDTAKELSEPEDQDYYGIGGRSARHSFIVVMALVYCSLTPMISLLAFVNCLMCRLVYGYLVGFAEIRKPDLGGAFWVTNMMNIQRCMIIYIILMSGVLCFRNDTIGPCCVAGASSIYWYRSFSRFEGAFRWESLSFEDICNDVATHHLKRVGTRSTYQQKELVE